MNRLQRMNNTAIQLANGRHILGISFYGNGSTDADMAVCIALVRDGRRGVGNYEAIEVWNTGVTRQTWGNRQRSLFANVRDAAIQKLKAAKG